MIKNAVLITLMIFESVNGTVLTGDGGEAQGAFHLHAIAVAEVNRVYGTHYRWPRDARDYETSREIAWLYIQHVGKKYKHPHEWYQQYRGGNDGVRQNVGPERAMAWEVEYYRQVRLLRESDMWKSRIEILENWKIK